MHKCSKEGLKTSEGVFDVLVEKSTMKSEVQKRRFEPEHANPPPICRPPRFHIHILRFWNTARSMSTMELLNISAAPNNLYPSSLLRRFESSEMGAEEKNRSAKKSKLSPSFTSGIFPFLVWRQYFISLGSHFFTNQSQICTQNSSQF